MGTVHVALERIFNQLFKGNVGLAIQETDAYLLAWPNPQTQEKLDTMKQEYQLMTGYWQQGMKDPQRDEQYLRLLQRLYVLCANISIHRHIENSSYLQGLYSQVRKSGNDWSLAAVRQEMEGFVSEVAMLELEPEQQRKEKSKALYQQHQQQMNALFNYILTSRLWTESVGQEITRLMLSPTVDTIDQQLVISAITLSQLNCFDVVKFRVLLNVYQQSQDEYVRQRALVGWILGFDDNYLCIYPELYQLVKVLLESERVCQELTELQIQFVYTLNAEKDNSTIQRDIMPDLLRNSQIHLTADGVKEQDDDELEDVLHPDAAEQRMESLENSVHRMMDMQQQGADIYFGGFSQMKRFPFFYDMSNWLVPFYLEHPDLAQYKDNSEGFDFVEAMMKHGPFCDSDKYSFVIVFQQVFSRLPSDMKEMMKHHEYFSATDEVAWDFRTPAYIRRMYLMNLYRFFRLFPNRSALFNPFDTSHNEMGTCQFFDSTLFVDTPLDKYKREIVPVLLKKEMNRSASILLAMFPQELWDIQYYLWRHRYKEALALEPHNIKALVGLARDYFRNYSYEKALGVYDTLTLLRPEKVSYLLNKAICQVQLEDYDAALQTLYQLNYKYPDNNPVKRALAWALVCVGKSEQADGLYEQLVAIENPEYEDFLNRGYCLWFLGRVTEAADSFRTYIRMCDSTVEDLSIFDEVKLFKKAGITYVEIRMMEALVES